MLKIPLILVVALWLGLGCGELAGQVAWRSSLYPEDGYDPSAFDLETQKGIQDFSYAGYRAGFVPLPSPAGPVFNVTLAPYFADATGAADATAAIQAAIDAAGANPGGGVVYLPAGTYRLSFPIESRNTALLLNKPGVVLRGAGVEKTFLLNTTHVFNTPGNTAAKAVIKILGPSGAGMTSSGPQQSALTSDVLTSTRVLPVASVSGFAVGQTVSARIDLTAAWIADTQEPGWIGQASALGGMLAFRRTVTAVDATARTITLDAPIRHPLKLRDNARLVRLGAAPISEVGLEDFSIGNVQHPGGGWDEQDYTDSTTAAFAVHESRLIEITRARDCWVRRVNTFRPAQNTSTAHLLSNGIRVNASTHVTIADCVFQRPQYGGGGGNGYLFTLYSSQECLIINSEARFSRHGFDIAALGASGNVVTQCTDRDTGLATGSGPSYATNGMGSDHHKHLSMANLFDTCTADASWFDAIYRPFGGTPTHGITSTNSVFWNTLGTGRLSSRMGNTTTYDYAVRTDQAGWGYVIGTRGTRSGVVTTQSASATNGQTGPLDHVEGVGIGDTLEPFSLYQDQLRRRFAPSLLLPDKLALPYPADTAEVTPSGFFIGPEPATAAQVPVVWTAPPGVGLTPLAQGGVRVRVPVSGRWKITATSSHGGFETVQHVVVVCEPPVPITTHILVAVADAYVRFGAYASNNYGSTTTMELKADSADFTRHALVRFDKSALAGRIPLAARLVLYSTNGQTTYSGWELNVHPLASGDWSEDTVTAATAPAFGAAAHRFGLSETRTDDVDISDLHLAEGGLSASSFNLGLSMRLRPVNNVVAFATRENSTSSRRPRLVIESFPAGSGFAPWIAAHAAVPESARGATDDPDGDGLANMWEMVLGGNPAVPDAIQPLRYDAASSTVAFSLPTGQEPGVRVGLETSTDLATWASVPLHASMIAVGADGVRLVNVPVSLAQGSRFWRLRAQADLAP